MDAISKALSEVYFSIPKEILQLAFNDTSTTSVISLDEGIVSRVIRSKVMVDCNIVGGVETYVQVDKCGVFNFSNDHTYEYVIDVPKYITNNRSIISPIGLFFGTATKGPSAGGSPVLMELSSQMAGMAPGGAIGTAKLDLIGENKVLVLNPTSDFVRGHLKCVVENEDNLGNLKPRTHIAFSELVILAVKAYIYNHLIFKINAGYIYNGHELGIVNDIVSNYSSSYEEYGIYLREKWLLTAFHNDTNRLDNIISGLF